MKSLVRLAALSLTLAAFGVGAAYADEYGVSAEHDQLITDGAKSMPAAPLSRSQAKIVEKMYDYHGTYPAPPKGTARLPLNHYATTGSSLSAPDVVGNGGPQDDTAREIHRPGSGTDW
ncbi:MAG TPA: hypothetical protein VJO12_14385 [Stellaceae bacterium]|nr:hypothetical protein [Stellaceae bacterium]